MTLAALQIAWCVDEAVAPSIARFFVTHAPASYISHAELQGGRATAPGRWAADLEARITTEARRAIGAGQGPGQGPETGPTGCVVARIGADMAGFAFVTFAPAALRPYAVIEDLLVDPARRGQGIGTWLVDWIAEACRGRGVDRLFLESGATNHEAHRFFRRHDFARTSIVMMRDLRRS